MIPCYSLYQTFVIIQRHGEKRAGFYESTRAFVVVPSICHELNDNSFSGNVAFRLVNKIREHVVYLYLVLTGCCCCNETLYRHGVAEHILVEIQ
jgi:hypothetical protein